MGIQIESNYESAFRSNAFSIVKESAKCERSTQRNYNIRKIFCLTYRRFKNVDIKVQYSINEIEYASLSREIYL